jgi:voltage-gated potassium channel
MPIFFRFFLHFVRHPSASFRVGLMLAAILTYGTTGFIYFEGPARPELSFTDGLWYSLATVTTVGYGDLAPATLGGRIVVALPLMVVGISLLGYVLSISASTLVQSKAKELHGMTEHRLSGHLVVFNFPGVAKVERLLDEIAADRSFSAGRAVVLVDEALEELPAELERRAVLFVRGNPTREETLQRASVDHATHAIVLAQKPGDPHSDDLNVAVTLALESKRRKLFTVVECIDYETEELLRKAGCDRVVCTSRFDAHFLSHELLSPGVQDVVEKLTSNLRGQRLHVTPFEAKAGASFSAQAERCRGHGHLLIGVQRDGKPLLNLAPDFELLSGDRLVTIGAERLPHHG